MLTNQSKSENGFELLKVRDIAKRRLESLSRTQGPVRACYLLKANLFVGVRYELGPFQFVWKLEEGFASITRNNLLIETVSLGGDDVDQRRAA